MESEREDGVRQGIPRFIQETGNMEDYLIDRKRGQNRRETLDFMFVIQQALT